MKQIDDMFARFVLGKKPLTKKWQVRYTHENGMKRMLFFHYHHLIGIYDCEDASWLYQWCGTQTDKRGLDAIKVVLSDNIGVSIRRAAISGTNHYKIQYPFIAHGG